MELKVSKQTWLLNNVLFNTSQTKTYVIGKILKISLALLYIYIYIYIYLIYIKY
jgi:hypothetical protein